MKYKVKAEFADCTFNGILGKNVIKKQFDHFTQEEIAVLQSEDVEQFNRFFEVDKSKVKDDEQAKNK